MKVNVGFRGFWNFMYFEFFWKLHTGIFRISATATNSVYWKMKSFTWKRNFKLFLVPLASSIMLIKHNRAPFLSFELSTYYLKNTKEFDSTYCFIKYLDVASNTFIFLIKSRIQYCIIIPLISNHIVFTTNFL